MSATEWLVVLLGAAAISWVNWYFFVAGRRSVDAPLVNETSGGEEKPQRSGR